MMTRLNRPWWRPFLWWIDDSEGNVPSKDSSFIDMIIQTIIFSCFRCRLWRWIWASKAKIVLTSGKSHLRIFLLQDMIKVFWSLILDMVCTYLHLTLSPRFLYYSGNKWCMQTGLDTLISNETWELLHILNLKWDNVIKIVFNSESQRKARE